MAGIAELDRIFTLMNARIIAESWVELAMHLTPQPPTPQPCPPVKISADSICFRLMQAIEATGTIDALSPSDRTPVKISADSICFRLMQAIEATGTIDAHGQLALDQPLQVTHPGRVRIIVLLTEAYNQTPERTQPHVTNSQPVRENQQPDTRPIWERVADISAQVPPEEWAKLPKDLSKNVDHYLYGAPKEDE